MTVDLKLLDAEERRAERNTSILMRMANKLNSIPRNDPRYAAVKLLLKEETRKESIRSERLLLMQFEAEMAE
ncbi:MAG: hypothetical protein DDT34_01883 [Firmicutes bacterium]|nr:hypothetical protein [Bacillota bacterium]MBT9165377.1 hypothetical protein [Chloroflexota bacterium]